MVNTVAQWTAAFMYKKAELRTTTAEIQDFIHGEGLLLSEQLSTGTVIRA